MKPGKNGTRWGQGLFVITAATATTVAAMGACGSAFNDCVETRTCSAEDSGGGAGGEAPDGAGAASGEANLVSAGNGAAGETSGAFDVLETSPEDSADGVERDAPIEVIFTADLDVETVSSGTFAVSGPAGVVSGKLEVDGAKVTFTPSEKLALLADYEVDVAASVAASDGTKLGAKRHFEFQSRDGTFRKPQRITGESVVGLSLVGSRSGYAAVYWSDGKNPASSFAAIFDASAESWGKVHPLESDLVKDYGSVEVCLNERGDAFATIGGAGYGAWSRWTAGAWSAASAAGVAQRRGCALQDDGTVLTFWSDTVNSTATAFVATQSSDNRWAPTKTVQTKASARGVARFNDGFLVMHGREPTGQLFSQVVNSKGEWSAAVPVTLPGESVNYTSLSTSESSALFIWGDSTDRLQASLFDGASWTTTDLGPAYLGKSTSGGLTGYLATWLYKGTAFAARYDATEGWLDPSKLGSSTAEDFGPGAALDDAGNALAIWPDGSKVSWKRSSHATLEWVEGDAFENQDPLWATYATAAASGEVIVVWQNQLGVWASRFE
jgi:hypothetical protein